MRTIKRLGFVVFLLLTAASAVAYTFADAIRFSRFAVGVFNASVLLSIGVAADYFLLDDFDTVEQLKDGNLAVAGGLIALALLLAPAVAYAQPTAQSPTPQVVSVAETYVGVTEEPPGTNKGEVVNRFLASVDLGPGYAWCAAYVSHVLEEAGADRPRVRSAGATDFLDARRVIDATDVLEERATPRIGDIGVMRRGNSWKGHTWFVDGWQRQCGETIEGNTSPGREGAQRDGDGVYKRTRCIHPGSYFRIAGFARTTV